MDLSLIGNLEANFGPLVTKCLLSSFAIFRGSVSSWPVELFKSLGGKLVPDFRFLFNNLPILFHTFCLSFPAFSKSLWFYLTLAVSIILVSLS